MPLLHLEGVSYSYPNRPSHKGGILHNISLQVHEGEVVGLLGSNGSGKSTLLHIASGLITPDAGSVRLFGLLCETEKNFAVARRSLGYLLQNADDMLFCPTILEDVAFGPYNSGKSSDESKALALETLTSLGLEQFAAFNGNYLSGGEKKMVALASILAMRPQLLFLDEPTNDLDPDSRQKLIEILAKFHLTTLVISHDTSFLDNFCTRFCTLEQGIMREEP